MLCSYAPLFTQECTLKSYFTKVYLLNIKASIRVFASCKLQITNYKLQITNYKLQIAKL